MKQETVPFAGSVDHSWRIGIVHSSYYKEETDTLVAGAVRALRAGGIGAANILTFAAPGSFEIPLLGAELARTKRVDALIGLGIIVEGQTHHALLIAEAVARGIMDVQVRHGVPFAFEVLYVDDLALARARLDRGEEAARAVLQSLALLRQIQS